MGSEGWRKLYPELMKVGGLGPAIAQQLGGAGDRAIAIEDQAASCVALRLEDRYAGFGLGAEQRGFCVWLGDPGFQHAYGRAFDLPTAVRVARAFLTGIAAETLAGEHPWLRLSPGLSEYLAGPVEYVAWTWARLRIWLVEQEPAQSVMKAVVPLLEAAHARSQLRQLFPFTSHTLLCFSRTTGYPFPMDCPYAYPVRSGWYRVVLRGARGEDEVLLGEGDAEQAADLLVAHLPDGCGPARHGNAGAEG